MSNLSRNRRTLLGAALATAGLAANHSEIAGKHKKHKKKCHAPTTKCGKRQCCQPGQICTGGHCQAVTTTSTTTPTPFTEVSCGGFDDGQLGYSRRVAQPFVANGTGKIASARYYVRGISAGTPFSVEIRATQNGVPTSNVLGTTFVIDTPAVPSSGLPYPVVATFDPKVPVTQGVTYALVVTDVASRGFALTEVQTGSCPLHLYYDNDATDDFQPTTIRSVLFAVSPDLLAAE